MTTASICTIGDEILIGQITDTNSAHISRALNSLGIKVSRMISIGDDHDEIIESLTEELQRNEIVIVTGGLTDKRRHNKICSCRTVRSRFDQKR